MPATGVLPAPSLLTRCEDRRSRACETEGGSTGRTGMSFGVLTVTAVLTGCDARREDEEERVSAESDDPEDELIDMARGRAVGCEEIFAPGKAAGAFGGERIEGRALAGS